MMSASFLSRALLLVLLVGGLVSCKEDDSPKLNRAAAIARSFHEAMNKRDIDALVRLVDYPFDYDGEVTAKDEAAFRKLLDTHWRKWWTKMMSAVYTEQVTYEAFVNGAEIRGQSYDDPEEAKKQAKKVGFDEGGVLVCCYHADKETNRPDARAYYLTIRPNALGDLKVVTYHD